MIAQVFSFMCMTPELAQALTPLMFSLPHAKLPNRLQDKQEESHHKGSMYAGWDMKPPSVQLSG